MEILEYDKYDNCAFKPLHTEEWLLSYFKKNYRKKTYDPFTWWRSFVPKKKPLDNKASFYEKVMNGDYELSPYKFEAELVEHRLRKKWFELNDIVKFHEQCAVDLARRKRLLEDHEKDEFKKLDTLFRGLSRSFNLSRDEVESLLDSFKEDSVKDFYKFLQKKFDDRPY